MPLWDAGITANGLIHFATMLPIQRTSLYGCNTAENCNYNKAFVFPEYENLTNHDTSLTEIHEKMTGLYTWR